MATLYNADLKPLTPGTYTHPYQHATKLFLADNFRLAPKQSFLYYVVININNNLGNDLLSQVTALFSQQIFTSAISSQTVQEQYEVGLLAKKVGLPNYKIATITKNAYNRKNVIQTGITYDPLTIAFHDDAADVVTKFWNDYYTYYYRDSDYTKAYYTTPHKYQPRLTDSWGFTPRNASVVPFLTSIQIFSLHNKRFTEYELINPYISDWRHGELNSEQGTGILENQMTVVFETVKYKTGYVNPIDVSGFATIHYDNVQSPISTSVTNIYDDNGLIGALANGTKDLARPDGQGSGANIFNALLNTYNLAKNLKNVNWTNLARQSIGSLAISAVNQAVNAALGNSITVPTASLGSGLVYNQSNVLSNPYSSLPQSNGVTIAGSPAGYNLQAGVINVGTNISNNFVNGVVTGSIQQGSTKLYQVSTNQGNNILVDQYGQPVTNQQTSLTLNEDGAPIGSKQVLSTTSGTYIPGDLETNRESIQRITDSNNQVMTVYTYRDGTQVTIDENGIQQKLVPGSNYTGNPEPIAVPQNSSALVEQGQNLNPAGLRYYTDPKTGVTYSIGGTSAQIVNTLSGTGGLIAGGYVTQGLYGSLTKGFLGQSVLGQSVAAGISGSVGLVTGRLVNNTLQPILNGVAGGVNQVFDSVSGTVKNTFSDIFGSGGFSKDSPNKNVVNAVLENDGTGFFTYKDGSQYFRDSNGKYTQVQAPAEGSGNWLSNLFGGSKSSSDGIAGNPNAGFTPATVWTDGSGNPITTPNGEYVWSGGQIPQSRDPFQDPNSKFYTPGEQSSNYINYASMTSQDFGVNTQVDPIASGDWTYDYPVLSAEEAIMAGA